MERPTIHLNGTSADDLRAEYRAAYTIPWNCGDKDCERGWHLGGYWIYADGSYSYDAYSDGDHEDVDEGDLPKHEEVAKAWRDYLEDVAATGVDPLGEVFLPTREVKERWLFRFRRSILGVVVMAKRNRRDWVSGRGIPLHVREYATADENGVVTGFGSWNEFVAALPEGLRRVDPITVQGSYTLTQRVGIKDPKSFIKKVARRGLRPDSLGRKMVS